MINTSVVINKKSDLSQTFQMGLVPFFASVGTNISSGLFDPWIVYDQYAGRFVIVAIGIDTDIPTPKAYVYLAVSKASTFSVVPVIGDWWMYRFDRTESSPSGDTFPDYEKLGYDDKAYYITGNNFPIISGSFQYVSLFAIRKTEVLAGNPAVILFSSTISNDFTLIPVQSYDATPTAMYFVSTQSNAIRIYTLTAILTVPVLVFQDVAVNAFTIPTNVTLPAPATIALDVGTDRLMSAVARNNRVWTAHTIIDVNVDPNRDLVRWYSFDISGMVYTVDQQQTISDTPSATDNLFMVHISVDPCNNMGIGFSIASTTRFPGIAYSGRAATDTPSTTQTMKFARVGDKTYQNTAGGTRNRWGDYSGLALDPSDNHTFWVYNEYAATDTSDPSTKWATFCGSFTVGCCNGVAVVARSGPSLELKGISVDELKPLSDECKNKFKCSIPNLIE